MTINFSRNSLLVFCRQKVMVVICAMLTCSLGDAVSAAPGQLDPTFGAGLGYVVRRIDPVGRSYSRSVAVLPNRQILAAGNCDGGLCATKFNSSGTLDQTYGVSGRAINRVGFGFNDGRSILVDGHGRALVAGSCSAQPNGNNSTGFCATRFLPDGAPDSSFGLGGAAQVVIYGAGFDFVNAIGLRTDGKILLAGECSTTGNVYDLCVAQLSEDGALDMNFGNSGRAVFPTAGGTSSGTSVEIQPDGRVLVSGYLYSGWSNFATWRLMSNGQLDATFGSGGLASTGFGELLPSALSSTDRGFASALQADGKVVVVGSCLDIIDGYSERFCLLRYDSSGSLDPSFGLNGKVVGQGSRSNPNRAIAVAIQRDGKLLVAGNCVNSLAWEFCLERFKSDGSIDRDFGANGIAMVKPYVSANQATSMALQRDGNIVVNGWCDNRFCLARFQRGPYDAADCLLNSDANQTVDPATDALLLTRYLLGFRGAALTTGAVGANPTRTGQALEDYLGTLNLDADGDGQALAMTDGLLMLRAMLGLTGTALTQGSTNASHPNVRNAQQILSWIENTHGVACLP